MLQGNEKAFKFYTRRFLFMRLCKKVTFTTMLLYSRVKNELVKIPAPIAKFAIKALVLFIFWHLMYSLILFPNRLVDKPLSMFTAKATAWTLNMINNNGEIQIKEIVHSEKIEGVTLTYEKATIYRGNKRIMGIADSCNGFSLCALFVGFIIAYPGKRKSKIWFSVIGVTIILLVNILRCVGLAYIIESYPSFAPFAHHYLYKLIIYAVVFILWMHFIKRQQHITHNV